MSTPPAPAPSSGTGAPSRASRWSRRRIVGLVVGAVLVVLAGTYAVAYAVARDRLPRDATIAGVAVGGLNAQAATARLTETLGPRARTVEVTVAGRRSTLDATASGLTVDYAASVARAGGSRSLDPRVLWRVLTGGSDVAPVVTVDARRLETAIAGLAARSDQAPRDATIAYAGSKPTVRTQPAVSGVTLDQPGARAAVERGYLVSNVPIELPSAAAEPAVTTAEVDQLATAYARPAVAAPVVVRAGSAGRFTISPAMIARSTVFSTRDGAPVAALDADRLRKAAAKGVASVELDHPRDATVRLRKGKPVVVPAVNGTTLGADRLAAAVTPALTKTGRDRTVDVELSGRAAAFTTADAEALGIKRVTGQFTTYFPYAEYRNVNIGRAAEKINGTVLKPGQTFSLNKIVGERTRKNGFVEGFIIRGSRFRKDLGGGVSQSATTTFNAMFFAGLKDVQHQPHGLYIDRYPPGREATVAWPTLDLKFTNDTAYGVLVQAYVRKSTPSRRGSITVKMWSTKTWDDVRSSALRRSNFTSGRDITDDGPDCEPQVPVAGFDVRYERLFYRDGKVVKRQPFRWRYAPTDKVTCKR